MDLLKRSMKLVSKSIGGLQMQIQPKVHFQKLVIY